MFKKKLIVTVNAVNCADIDYQRSAESYVNGIVSDGECSVDIVNIVTPTNKNNEFNTIYIDGTSPSDFDSSNAGVLSKYKTYQPELAFIHYPEIDRDIYYRTVRKSSISIRSGVDVLLNANNLFTIPDVSRYITIDSLTHQPAYEEICVFGRYLDENVFMTVMNILNMFPYMRISVVKSLSPEKNDSTDMLSVMKHFGINIL